MSLIDCLLVSKCTTCGKKKQTHHLCFCEPFFKHFDYGCTIQRQLFLWNYKKYFATTHNSWVKMLYQPCLIPDIPRHLCLGVSCQSQIYQKEKSSQISENPILPHFESLHFGFQILIKPRLLNHRFYLFVCVQNWFFPPNQKPKTIINTVYMTFFKKNQDSKKV